MKITILGTAAISYPFPFCNCNNCKLARIHKGKSIRKNSSILINDDLLIDLCSDVPIAMDMYNKDMGTIKYLLQTHTHYDHFSEYLLINRISNGINKNQNKLEIYSHPKCFEYINKKILDYENIDIFTEEGREKLNININNINKGDKVSFGTYQVKAIETEHDLENGSLLYVITENDKNFFYATDTNALTDNALNQLSEYKLDIVIMDHTYGNVNNTNSHLNENLFLDQISKLKKLNIIDEQTLIYGTHISHVGLSYHELIEELAIKKGYHIAYDGMKLEI